MRSIGTQEKAKEFQTPTKRNHEFSSESVEPFDYVFLSVFYLVRRGNEGNKI